MQSRRFLVSGEGPGVWSYDQPERPVAYQLNLDFIRSLLAMGAETRKRLMRKGVPGARPAVVREVEERWSLWGMALEGAKALLPAPKVPHGLALISHTEDGIVLHYEDGFRALIGGGGEDAKLVEAIQTLERLPMPVAMSGEERTEAKVLGERGKMNLSMSLGKKKPEKSAVGQDEEMRLLKALQGKRPDALVGVVRVIGGISAGRPILGTEFDGTPMPLVVERSQYLAVLRGLKAGQIKAGAFGMDAEGAVVLLETFESGRWVSRQGPMQGRAEARRSGPEEEEAVPLPLPEDEPALDEFDGSDAGLN